MKQLLDENPIELDDQDKTVIVQITCQDNLDLGCNLIKNAVILKATEDVINDAVIKEAVEKRRLARERGEQFKDDKIMSTIPSNIPISLRPNPYAGFNFGNIQLCEIRK